MLTPDEHRCLSLVVGEAASGDGESAAEELLSSKSETDAGRGVGDGIAGNEGPDVPEAFTKKP
jgi:hypothetical protein